MVTVYQIITFLQVLDTVLTAQLYMGKFLNFWCYFWSFLSILCFFWLFETRSKYVQGGEEVLWADVTQQLMSDEEDLNDGLQVKTPYWRSDQLSERIEKLDEGHLSKKAYQCHQVLRKKRAATESPMKRKPSKKIEGHLLIDHIWFVRTIILSSIKCNSFPINSWNKFLRIFHFW